MASPRVRISPGSQTSSGTPVFRSREEHIAAGKALREATPRKSHAEWNPLAERHDPIATLEESNRDRLPELVPIRYGRMLRTPLHVSSGFRRSHGQRSGGNAQHGHPGPGLRGLPSAELWPVRQPRAAPVVRYQRLRRDAARPLGVGRETPGGQRGESLFAPSI